MPIMDCLRVILSRLFANTAGDDRIQARADLLDWLTEKPVELMTEEEREVHEDDLLFAALGINRQVAEREAGLR